MTKTTCDWTVERLPWWVNGTLEAAEAQRVEAHLAECATCRDELAATRGALALYGAHLPIEALLDLVEGEAIEGEAGEREAGGSGRGAALSSEAVAAHLGHCPSCREQLALLRESRAAVEGESAAREPTGATVTPFAPRSAQTAPPLRRRRLDRRSLELAASLLFCVVAAGGWLSNGLTAERRADRIAKLEQQWAEATAARDAGERTWEPPPAAGTPEEMAAALKAAEERQADAVARIAELEAALEGPRPPAESGERITGPLLTWEAFQPVTRGVDERPAELLLEVPADAEQAFIFIPGVPDEPLRLEFEDVVSGRLIEQHKLSRYDRLDVGVHTTFELPLARLPADVRLRLFAGGEEIDTLLLHIAR